jgi:hypothetical protein
VKRIRAASLEDLYEVKGVPKTVAEAVYEALHLNSNGSKDEPGPQAGSSDERRAS